MFPGLTNLYQILSNYGYFGQGEVFAVEPQRARSTRSDSQDGKEADKCPK